MKFVSMAIKKFCKLTAKQIPGFKLRASLFRMAGYQIGEKVYIGEDLIIIDELDQSPAITIGDRAAIAPRVTLIVSSKPNFAHSVDRAAAYGPVIIGEDAWIGTGVIIMPNVRIGNGAVIGAGSIVTADIPPYTVAAGQPARILRMHKKGVATDDIVVT